MLTAEVKRLRDTFESWLRGERIPTIEDWRLFLHDLQGLQFKVAMLELGVDLTVVDVAVELNKPGSNVLVFQPRKRAAVPVSDGGAS